MEAICSRLKSPPGSCYKYIYYLMDEIENKGPSSSDNDYITSVTGKNITLIILIVIGVLSLLFFIIIYFCRKVINRNI